jgi:hypothetical protein
MSPHQLGMLGELFNFAGALIMALDIFLRGRERLREKKLDKIGQFARVNQLNRTIYRGSHVTSTRFPLNVLDKKATVIAYIGTACFAVGFLLLVAYHYLEMKHQGPHPKDIARAVATFVG